jgi:hypothetical protein
LCAEDGHVDTTQHTTHNSVLDRKLSNHSMASEHMWTENLEHSSVVHVS